jgi:hypothetical protein
MWDRRSRATAATTPLVQSIETSNCGSRSSRYLQDLFYVTGFPGFNVWTCYAVAAPLGHFPNRRFSRLIGTSSDYSRYHETIEVQTSDTQE